jgi:hypothetical protein
MYRKDELLMKKLFRLAIYFSTVALLLSGITISSLGEENSDLLPDSKTYNARETIQSVVGSEEADKLLYVENDNFLLSLNTENGYLYVVDKRNNMLWESNPANASEDEVASGINRTNLRSQLIIDFEESGNTITKSSMNSTVGCFSRGEVKFEQIKSGFRATYVFAEEGITIPLEYRITDTGFETEVLLSQIKEEGNNKLYSLCSLPFFGAGSNAENGYLLIPDGSGALIYFNNGKGNLQSYSKDLFGGDGTLEDKNPYTGEKNIQLPLFGIKKENGACLAIIDKGASNCTISAYPSGNISSYNSINSTFCYRANGVRGLMGSRTVLFSALDSSKIESYLVRYVLLTGEDAGCSGMASAYRDYLLKNGMEKKTYGKARLFVELYGATFKEKSFLGIRYNGIESLTTFKQAQAILETLKKGGVDSITASYKGFSSSEISGKIACQPVPLRQLGGKKGFRGLHKFAGENGVSIYPYADWIHLSDSGNGFSKYSDVALGLELSAYEFYPYKISTGIPSKSENPIYNLRPDRYSKAIEKILSSLEKSEFDGVYLENAVQVISSDYSKDGIQRDRSQDILTEHYRKLAQKGGLLMSAPNSYAIPFAEGITDLPLTSSRYLVFDEDVPFLQMVLHGVIDYSAESANIGGQSKDTLLKHIETGSNLKYSFIYNDGIALVNTKLDYLYAAHYNNYITQAEEWYAEIAKVKNITSDALIVSRQMKDGLVTVVYSNGARVYVNYADSPCNVDGVTVEAKDYLVVAKGKVE